MRRYDRDWKKIGDYVGTKTVIQVRSAISSHVDHPKT